MITLGMLITAVGAWILGATMKPEYKYLALLGYVITIIGGIIIGLKL